MSGPSRKYVDLIFKASGKYGNWDPPHVVEVGDWGHIERATGNFIREGNIFTDTECKVLLSDVPDGQLVRTGSPENVVRITANAQMEIGGDVYTDFGTTGELAVRAHASWAITPRNRAAILTMTDAYSYYLEIGTVFPRLRSLRKLEGKAVVTEALHCPAYAMLLTEKGIGGKASLTLHTGLSEAGVVLATGGTAGWHYNSESGLWRTACGYRKTLEEHRNSGTLEEHDAVFTPLYRLKKVSRGWRRYRTRGALEPELALEEPVSEDYFPPWEELNEDGEEISTVPDY
ncbi:hypothetical protein RSAG8_07257, partial [Rhizoctonia solani AG-8 WAC10335]